METSAVPLLAEKQNSSTKLLNITPAEALAQREKFEPKIYEVFNKAYGEGGPRNGKIRKSKGEDTFCR